MKVVIVGAGGIGAYYGARLLEAGHKVIFVARSSHLDALQSSGLTVKHADFEFSGPVDACGMDALAAKANEGSVDLVILTLKSAQTAPVLAQMRSWLSAAHCPVLSLQNGVDNEIEIAEVVGETRTWGGLAVRIGGHIVEPGVIEATGPAQVVLGQWPVASVASQARLAECEAAFNQAGIPTRVSPDIRHELWMKLLINNGVNPLSALCRVDTRTLTSHPVYGKTVYRIMQETAAAARADDVDITPAQLEEMYQLICQFDAIKTSMLVDREKGRPMEIDAISGAVLRRCERLGIEAPLTALVAAMLLEFQAV